MYVYYVTVTVIKIIIMIDIVCHTGLRIIKITYSEIIHVHMDSINTLHIHVTQAFSPHHDQY